MIVAFASKTPASSADAATALAGNENRAGQMRASGRGQIIRPPSTLGVGPEFNNRRKLSGQGGQGRQGGRHMKAGGKHNRTRKLIAFYAAIAYMTQLRSMN